MGACAISAFRFVHAADIHLDSPLKTLALRDPALSELIGSATRKAFVATINLCIDEQVDALLIAGDLYDGDQTSMKTALFLAAQLERLEQAGVRTFIIRGNHDNLSKITRELSTPKSVKVFSHRAEAVEIERPAGRRPVVIHGVSFKHAKAPDSLVAQFKPARADAINIGMLHTSLGGAQGHDDYAPCSIAELQATGFHYWALGHIHKRSVLHGPGAIVMPGIPQGRDINESGAKSVTLASISDDGHIHLEERVTSIAQFERLDIDVSGADAWEHALRLARKQMEAARREAASEHLVARVRLTGNTSLAWRLRRDADLMKTELDHIGASLGNCLVESLDIDCRADNFERANGHPLQELANLVASDVMTSDAFMAEADTIARTLQSQLPPELRDLFGADETASRARLSALAQEGLQEVLATLHHACGETE